MAFDAKKALSCVTQKPTNLSTQQEYLNELMRIGISDVYPSGLRSVSVEVCAANVNVKAIWDMS